MPTGTVKSSNVADYLGELFQSGKRPNNFLKMAGGIQQGIQVSTGLEFPVGVFYNLRAPSQPARLEGADAPAAEYRAPTQATNVVQIFQEAVNTTYLAASDNTMSGPVSLPLGKAQGRPVDARDPAFQVMAALDTVSQDANYTFLNGVYAKPADPSATALKTRGILTAITTTVQDKSADAVSGTTPEKQVRGYITALTQAVIAQNGYNPDGTWTLMADSASFGTVIGAYEALPSNRTAESVEIAGLKIRTLNTRYGTIMIALDPDMPANTIAVFNMGVVGVVGLPVPNKGIVFEEALAKTGSTDKTQIYGQLGIDHGPEWAHGKLILPAGFNL